MMLDLFLRLIDRLIQLVEARNVRDRKLFEDHVDLIYTDLKLVIDDYEKAFADIEKMLSNPEVPISSVLKKLQTRRRKYARVREGVRRYAEVLKAKSTFDEVTPFAQFCLNLLAFDPASVPASTGFTSLIEEFNEILRQSKDTAAVREQCLGSTQHFSELLSTRWMEVLHEYHNLRVDLLK